MKSVLTIAGSDSSGGAGIQADIKTISALGLFAQSAITALTAQNTTGVYGVVDVEPYFVSQQIDVVFDDIVPDAVKVGMVSNPAVAMAIARSLVRKNASNIVVDPVMVATSGAKLISDEALEALVGNLFPLASVITPNIPEAKALSGMPIANEADVEAAARIIAEKIQDCDSFIAAGNDSHADTNKCSPNVSVLIKGGHGVCASGECNDYLLDGEGVGTWIGGKRIDNPNTHGTGCTLSSAIACGLALGMSVHDACRYAKDYISGALAAGLNLGAGSGPLNHMWRH